MNYSDPLRGGLLLRRRDDVTKAGCTTGFVGFETYAGSTTHVVTTAGHCFPQYTDARQGNLGFGSYRLIGNTSFRSNNGSYSDAAAIETGNRRRNWVYATSLLRERPVTAWQRNYEDGLFDIVCMAGSRSPGAHVGENCGYITSRTFSPGSSYLPVFRRATYSRTSGDSGAPVYSANLDGNLLAVGLHTGGVGTDAYYTHIHEAVIDLYLTGIRVN
jgi:hypothetical protein